MKNFHLPLPDQTYLDLRSAAESAKVPATALARQAIDAWLTAQAKQSRHDAIAAYAKRMAATEFDLDPDLEAAGLEVIGFTK